MAVSQKKLNELAKKFSKDYTRKEASVMAPHTFKQHLKVVRKRVEAEAVAHRMNRKRLREAAAKK